MASEIAAKAQNAFVDDDFESAADLYTQAIELNPNDADLFADRAQANIKLGYFTAVADANKAIELDPSMAKAYLRKGTAFLKLEEYYSAKATLEKGSSLANDERFSKLIKECEELIAENCDLGSSESNTVIQLSDRNSENLKVAVEQQNGTHQRKEISAVNSKYRHAFFQKPEEVVVTIFAKGVPANNVTIDFGEQILSVTIDVPSEDVYHFQPRLFGKIVPDKCRYEVLSTKIEIRLAKAEPINWTTLEYTTAAVVPPKITSTTESYRPTYPSSKPKRVDWDKLEAQVKKEEKEEKLDGDAALNKFFGDIYKNADEDMRRAMNKSFIESNGTVLSTDWKDVGSKEVVGSPPDGMELKKW
ncbi:suppressor of G2 allele of SKP1 [Olea europaea subsp. europaea]|uniref:Protein SGT1 homolog n=1 Tax=Olea europaea subsp. europaea TaxID=158383 RepID=A0A8S0V3D3_OLEEU|nr:suppressor of G2 allele of SKP1 [Olea europaea subsp. europaea]